MKTRTILKIQFVCLIVALISTIAMIVGGETDRPWLITGGMYSGLASMIGAVGAPLLQDSNSDD